MNSLFPLHSEVVSIRGLAPKKYDESGLNTDEWLDDQTFSLRNIAKRRIKSPFVFDGNFPHSVREIITPQTHHKQWRRLDEHGTTISKKWTNWLNDYPVEVIEELGSSANKSSDAKTSITEISGVWDWLRLKFTNLVHNDTNFRAVGSGHSHSEAAVPKKYYTNMKRISGKITGTKKWLKGEESSIWALNSEEESHQKVVKDNLIHLAAGTILKYLNRKILPAEDLALPNMGAWDGQTLAGAINTSTHGTGLQLGTFADLVRSVEIMTVVESEHEEGTPYVRMLRIEPSNGITDPVKFAKNTTIHNMGLIQNDDLFHSVVVGYGSMGIVLAYTLELQKAYWPKLEHKSNTQKSYWLKEKNTIKKWGNFNPNRGANNNRHYSIYVDLISPQLDGRSEPPCLVRKRNPVKSGDWSPTERKNIFNIPEKIMDALFPMPTIFKHDEEIDYEELAEQIRQINDIQEGFFNLSPEQMFGYDPAFRKQKRKTASYIALRRRRARHPNKAKKPPEQPSHTITMEVGVPVSDVVPAVNEVIEFVKNTSRFLPAPLGVRFTGPSHHYFSPEYNRPTAMLELPIPNPEKLKKEFDNVKTIYDESGFFRVGGFYTNPKKIFYQKLKRLNQETGVLDHFLKLGLAKKKLETIEDILVKKFDGRPHLGKHNTINANSSRRYMRPQNIYPKYDNWKAAFNHFNKFGTFEGAFSNNKVS